MTVKEYLRQAYRLDQQISSDLEEVASLREMAISVSSPQLAERVQTSGNTDAPFVRALEKIMNLEERTVITTVEDTDERMVLKYRYVHNYTWEQIGNVLHADARTVRRWHGKALQHVILPDNSITI